MKHKVLYGAVGVLIIAIAFGVSGALINSKAAPKKDEQQHNTIYVKVTRAAVKEIAASMEYRGRVTAFDNVVLSSEVSGKLLQADVRFKEGESFKKGDVLLNIYSEDVEAELKSDKSNLLQTLSKILPDLKVDFSSEYPKWKNFFNSIDPEIELPELPIMRSEKEKVFLAANNVLSSYYKLQKQEINLQRYQIKAPFNGSFVSVSKEIGAVANSGAELAKIIRSDRLEIIVPVFPTDLRWIKRNDWAEISTGKSEESKVKAKVSRIAGFVDETTQSVNVYLSLDVKNTSILQGQYVDVIFEAEALEGIQIPREALVDNHFVYELSEGSLKKHKVQVKREMDDSYIVSGIADNKQIVIESLASVHPSVEYLPRN